MILNAFEKIRPLVFLMSWDSFDDDMLAKLTLARVLWDHKGDSPPSPLCTKGSQITYQVKQAWWAVSSIRNTSGTLTLPLLSIAFQTNIALFILPFRSGGAVPWSTSSVGLASVAFRPLCSAQEPPRHWGAGYYQANTGNALELDFFTKIFILVLITWYRKTLILRCRQQYLKITTLMCSEDTMHWSKCFMCSTHPVV